MINQEFDHIISLGGHCQTAHQIRRHFGVDVAYPFDWWVTPTWSLIELFETGFAEIFDEKNMRIVNEKTGSAVTCARYGLMHYHDFDEAKVNDIYSPYLIRVKCAQNNAKYSFLVSRFLKTSGRVLFIRFAHGWTEFDTRVSMFDGGTVRRAYKAITELLPSCDVHLLLLNDYKENEDLQEPGDKKIFTYDVNNYEAVGWDGSDQGWDEMFSALQIRLRVS